MDHLRPIVTRRRNGFVAKCLTLAALPLLLAATDPPPRAKPPKWSADVLDVFFEDARDHLIGPRPADKSPAVAEDPAGPSPRGNKPSADDLVSPDVLTTEIKRLYNGLTVVLRSPATFRSEANARCRRDFGMLSLLFDVVGKLESEVRWQPSAALMRWKCARAEAACHAGSDDAYAAAKHVHQQLGDLIRGQTPDERIPPVAVEEQQSIDRTLLMQWMEQATEEKMPPVLANVKEFRKASREVAHQAQLLALLARRIVYPTYEYADDETFVEYAAQLRAASDELNEASEQRDYQRARDAAGRVMQSCSRCHEGYRG